MAASSGPDATVNKVALCSAVFAGFAYVGYSIFKTAFKRHGRRKRAGEILFKMCSPRLTWTA